MIWEDFNNELFRLSGMRRDDFYNVLGGIDMSLEGDIPGFSRMTIPQQQGLIKEMFERRYGIS